MQYIKDIMIIRKRNTLVLLNVNRGITWDWLDVIYGQLLQNLSFWDLYEDLEM